jgi:hypothetical protein
VAASKSPAEAGLKFPMKEPRDRAIYLTDVGRD